MHPDVAEIDEPVDRAQHVIRRYVSLEAELVEQCVLNDLPLAHHRCVSSLDDAIESLAQQRDKLGVFQQNRPEADLWRRAIRLPSCDLSSGTGMTHDDGNRAGMTA
jgi:hypothetical protein